MFTVLRAPCVLHMVLRVALLWQPGDLDGPSTACLLHGVDDGGGACCRRVKERVQTCSLLIDS